MSSKRINSKAHDLLSAHDFQLLIYWYSGYFSKNVEDSRLFLRLIIIIFVIILLKGRDGLSSKSFYNEYFSLLIYIIYESWEN